MDVWLLCSFKTKFWPPHASGQKQCVAILCFAPSSAQNCRALRVCLLCSPAEVWKWDSKNLFQQGPCVPLCAAPKLPKLSVIRLAKKRSDATYVFFLLLLKISIPTVDVFSVLLGTTEDVIKNCRQGYCVCASLFRSFKSQVVPWRYFWPKTIEQRNMFCSFFCSKLSRLWYICYSFFC